MTTSATPVQKKRYPHLQWLPNAITLCRSLLAFIAFILALQHNWDAALWLFLAALVTDFLDGLAAKKLHATSAFGEQFDAWSDSFVVAAGMLSLSITGHLSWWITVAVLAAGALVGSDRVFKQPAWRWRTAVAVSCLFVSWTGIGWLYAYLAYNWSWWYVGLTIIVLVVCGMLKRHRIRAWVGGRSFMTRKVVKHPSGIRQEIVDKVVARRGRLHAFPRLNPATTALIVIDLDLGTGRDGEQQIQDMAANITAVARALRKQGGTVAWVTTPITKATDNFRAVFGEALTDRYEADAASGRSATLWPELEPQTGDIHAFKQGHSAFFPGKSNLHEQLQAKGIDTILVAGAVTNICCEASARDAAELGYKVTMISDALIGHSYGLHEASLATFFRCYGDVRPTEEIAELIKGDSDGS